MSANAEQVGNSENAEARLDELEAERVEARRFGLERLVFFSDAVFAIAITLLALELRLPEGFAEKNSRELAREIFAMWPEFLAVLISFYVIGQNWMGHHRRFSYVKAYDRTLIDLNLVLLFFIVLMPFPASVLAQTVNTTSVVFYAGIVTVISIVTWAMWRHMCKDRRLLQEFVTDGAIQRESTGLIFTIAVFALSIVLAFFIPDYAMFAWLLLLGTNWVVGRRVRVL